MPCPVASALSLSAVIGGFYTLLAQDLRLRRLSWILLFTLIGGWTAYYTQGRVHDLRIILDAASTLAVLAGGARVYYLIRYRGVVPPLHRPLTRFMHAIMPVVKSPTVLSLKIWLLCMIVGDMRGISSFSAVEYWVVSVLLVAAIVYKSMHVWAAKKKTAYPDLEEYSQNAVRCPLGFGCETSMTENSVRAATESKAVERAKV